MASAAAFLISFVRLRSFVREGYYLLLFCHQRIVGEYRAITIQCSSSMTRRALSSAAIWGFSASINALQSGIDTSNFSCKATCGVTS